MRARKLFVGMALVLLAGLSACGEVQEAQEGVQQAKDRVDQAQQGLDNASACTKALEVTSFTPDFSDVEKAKADSQAKIDEISGLAEQTADQTLKENLVAVQQSLEKVTAGEVTMQNSLDWTQKHLDKTSEVALTCGKMVE